MAKKSRIKWSERDSTWKTWFIAGWLQGSLMLIVVIILLVYYFGK
ncbi:hypothetical protein [Sporolactobacillus pectinivorans]|nr:hypothetical protein [Sporolactobacillus pectinivorans]